MRNLQEQVKKAILYQKLFWPFTVQINCSSDLKNFAISRPSDSNFESFSSFSKTFFCSQNIFWNKIPELKVWLSCNTGHILDKTQYCGLQKFELFSCRKSCEIEMRSLFFFGKGRIKENFCMLALSQATKFMYCTNCG